MVGERMIRELARKIPDLLQLGSRENIQDVFGCKIWSTPGIGLICVIIGPINTHALSSFWPPPVIRINGKPRET